MTAPVAFPNPDLATLGDTWQRTLVLPAHPAIPQGTELWHRRTPDGYLAVVVYQDAQRLYQVQVLHRVLDPLERLQLAAEPAAVPGRPPSIDELREVLGRFTPHGRAFGLLFISQPGQPGWTNPVMFALSEVGMSVMPAPAQDRRQRH